MITEELIDRSNKKNKRLVLIVGACILGLMLVACFVGKLVGLIMQ